MVSGNCKTAQVNQTQVGDLLPFDHLDHQVIIAARTFDCAYFVEEASCLKAGRVSHWMFPLVNLDLGIT